MEGSVITLENITALVRICGKRSVSKNGKTTKKRQ